MAPENELELSAFVGLVIEASKSRKAPPYETGLGCDIELGARPWLVSAKKNRTRRSAAPEDVRRVDDESVPLSCKSHVRHVSCFMDLGSLGEAMANERLAAQADDFWKHSMDLRRIYGCRCQRHPFSHVPKPPQFADGRAAADEPNFCRDSISSRWIHSEIGALRLMRRWRRKRHPMSASGTSRSSKRPMVAAA
jgi:hypothetical protein